MFDTQRSFCTALFCAALASTSGVWAAESGVTGQGSFRPPDGKITLPADSPFSAEDLLSGRVSFAIRWDDAAPDRDPNLYRGLYVGAIRQFTVRVGASEINLPVDGALIEVSDGADVPYREFVRLQASWVMGGHTFKVGWMSLNETSKSGDLRGPAGRLANDLLPNAEGLAGFQPTGRFDRSFFVTLGSNTDPRRFPVYLQTSDIEIKVTPVAATASR